MVPVTGPFQTEREAREAAQAWPAGGVASATPNLTMLLDACIGAGVHLGAWDARIVEWLAGYEPSACAVIAGLISRAHQAGQAREGEQR